jgi:hypothetical protein
MMNTVVIPAEVVNLLRDGLRSQIAVSAQDISSAEEAPEDRCYPERYQKPLRSLDALRALMEEIGWSTPPSELKVDLDTHAWALTAALQDQVSEHAAVLREPDPHDEQRAAIPRNINALSSLALIVLLRTQAQMLQPGARAATGSSG